MRKKGSERGRRLRWMLYIKPVRHVGWGERLLFVAFLAALMLREWLGA